MTSTAANRAAFISSLQSFMTKYGFEGVALDWEFPSSSTRGGSPSDTRNLVNLVQEMRIKWGHAYGISVALPPDHTDLSGFDANSMQSSVDWFDFMSYDLQGTWDSTAIGSVVRGQTDIRDIQNATIPLWFDDLDPAKLNLGIARYGRGYTLASKSCTSLGCQVIGPSLAAPCTNSAGIMSLTEIQTLILQKGLFPKLLNDSMMKQITWDDQWIGYDDSETIALKKTWADSLCFGGTMIWSVDFAPSNTDRSVVKPLHMRPAIY